MRRTTAWLAGTTLSLIGTQAMGFALVWAAAAHGPRLAALTLTAIVVPRVLLTLPGGALADRAGAVRVLIAADLAAAVCTSLFALLLLLLPGAFWLLPLIALTSGLADAVYLPASATVPRLLTERSPSRSTVVPGHPATVRASGTPGRAGAGGLSRTMAARQIAGQAAALAGPALGGFLVTVAGVAPVVGANAVTFAAMAVVLRGLRPHLDVARAAGEPVARPAVAAGEGGHAAGSAPARATRRAPATWETAAGSRKRTEAVRGTGEGLRVVAGDPVLRAALGLTAVAAAFLLPVGSLLLPLLARARDWPGPHTGLLAAAIAGGTGAVALLVLLRGACPRPGVCAAGGLLVAAAGIAVLAVSRGLLPAAAGALVTGAGSGIFATHLGPLFLGRAPRTHLARTQSVLVLAQSVPLLVTQNAFGVAVAPLGVPSLLLICGSVLVVASGVALCSGPLRTA